MNIKPMYEAVITALQSQSGLSNITIYSLNAIPYLVSDMNRPCIVPEIRSDEAITSTIASAGAARYQGTVPIQFIYYGLSGINSPRLVDAGPSMADRDAIRAAVKAIMPSLLTGNSPHFAVHHFIFESIQPFVTTTGIPYLQMAFRLVVFEPQ